MHGLSKKDKGERSKRVSKYILEAVVEYATKDLDTAEPDEIVTIGEALAKAAQDAM